MRSLMFLPIMLIMAYAYADVTGPTLPEEIIVDDTSTYVSKDGGFALTLGSTFVNGKEL